MPGVYFAEDLVAHIILHACLGKVSPTSTTGSSLEVDYTWQRSFHSYHLKLPRCGWSLPLSVNKRLSTDLGTSFIVFYQFVHARFAHQGLVHTCTKVDAACQWWLLEGISTKTNFELYPFFNKSIPLLLVLLTTLWVFFKRSLIINGPTPPFFFLANRSQRHVWLPRTKLKCRRYRNSFKRSHCFSGRQCEGVGRNTSVIVMFIGCPWPFHSTRRPRRSEGKQFISKQIMRRISRNNLGLAENNLPTVLSNHETDVRYAQCKTDTNTTFVFTVGLTTQVCLTVNIFCKVYFS